MEEEFEDPIVAEVRRAGLQMEREAGGDVHQYFENLRKAQEKYKDRLVTRAPNMAHPKPAVGE